MCVPHCINVDLAKPGAVGRASVPSCDLGSFEAINRCSTSGMECRACFITSGILRT